MTRKDKYMEMIHTLFIQNGVRGLTMEDIAERINVTKMTLYNNFKDKETLLEEIMAYRTRRYMSFRDINKPSEQNAITTLVGVLKFQRNNSLESSYKLYTSIKEVYPKLYAQHKENFKHGLSMFIRSNIEQGIREGVYRDDVSSSNITSYIMASMDGVFDSWLTGNVDLNQTHKQIIDYHIRGISNDKGIKILEEELKKLQKE